ncbi:MAG: IS1182 family transposase [Thermomicrobiales bacterium]
MARYKEVDRSPRFLPVVLSDQIQPGTFEFTLDWLVDHELALAALDARFHNDETGAPAYDPRVMLKIVLLGYSRGLVSSRAIERACRENVTFIALSGDSAPSYTHIAKFVRELGDEVAALFTQVLMTCDRLGLIGKELFAIDGVKLPSNASKERSGTHAELLHRAERLEKAADKIIETHRARDEGKGDEDLDAKRRAQVERIRRESRATREFVATHPPKRSAKGHELKSNVTDNDSAKMATGKGVIQGYAAQAAVDAKHRVIVAADLAEGGTEQASLLPMIEAARPLGTDQTLITADAGYHSKDNLEALRASGTPVLVADPGMRKRDERLKDQAKHKAKGDPLHDKRGPGESASKTYKADAFRYDPETNRCICPAGKALYSSGSEVVIKGITFHRFKGAIRDCGQCELRRQCLRDPGKTRIRQVAINLNRPKPVDAMTLMRKAIDSPAGRSMYGRRIGTVEPVFANLRHNKRLTRFTLRGRCRVRTQWFLYCLVNNIETIARC